MEGSKMAYWPQWLAAQHGYQLVVTQPKQSFHTSPLRPDLIGLLCTRMSHFKAQKQIATRWGWNLFAAEMPLDQQVVVKELSGCEMRGDACSSQLKATPFIDSWFHGVGVLCVEEHTHTHTGCKAEPPGQCELTKNKGILIQMGSN